MSLNQNSKQQEALIKVTIETDHQDRPDLDTGKMPGIGTYQNQILFQKYLPSPQA